jgi:hypothetical protein
MFSADDAELQRAREAVYDARWDRHRDQALVALTAVVVLALLAFALLSHNVLFVGAALGTPAGGPAVLRAFRRALPRQ